MSPARIPERWFPATREGWRPARPEAVFRLSLVVVGLICAEGLVHAAPPGKAWAPVVGFQEPGFDWIVGPRLDLTAPGTPRLYGTAVKNAEGVGFGIAYDWASAGWGTARMLGIQPLYLFPVDASASEHHLLYVGGTLGDSRKLLWAEDDGNEVAPPEHIASTYRQYEVNYAGATRGSRRWAAIRDRAPNIGFLRMFTSIEGGPWQELPVEDPASGGMSMLAMDDTTMILVWDRTQAGQGLGWGVLRGDSWEPVSEPIQTGYFSSPRLRHHPDGGAWLTYSTGTVLSSAGIRRLGEGAWSSETLLECAYIGGAFGNYLGSAVMSLDDAPRPIVAWNFGSFLGAGSGICVCMPDETGWGIGDEIFRGAGGGVSVLRDRNGDAWVAWGDLYQPLRWTHTYTTATAGEPVVTVGEGRPALAWKLSEPAPGTWWAVLRQASGGEFAEVARVQAGTASEMSWVDLDYRPGGLLRDGVSYRIRRESVDTRYEHLGPVGTWRPGHMKLRLSIRPQGPGSDALVLELSGMGGSRAELLVYDVSGRVVERREMALRAGAAVQTFPLTPGVTRRPAGVYFARVRDESGAVSDGVKFVRLR